MNEADIDDMLRRLHLANTRRVYPSIIQKAETNQWSYHDFLVTLLQEEVAHRQQTRLQRVSQKAGFPFLKTIDEYDFTHQSMIRLNMLGSYLTPDFVTEGRSLILSGKPGRGKTHLAIALAYRAIQNGFEARFTTAASLIDDLSRASREGRLNEALVKYVHPSVLVIDEVGYLTYGTDAANVLFHVVNERHQTRRSMIFTTNKPVKSWGKVLHDEDLAEAIVDRILERGRLVNLDGASMRTRHIPAGELEATGGFKEPAIVSGINPPNFPEPTPPSHSVLTTRTGSVWRSAA